MRIGIDMRMAGTGEGIGRYSEELVKHLALVDQTNDYILLFSDPASSSKFKIENSKFRNQIIHSKYYSFAEQTMLIGELNRLHLDIMHFSSFNVPVLYPGKFVVTIHDLIHHFFPGKKKSRLLHRLAYRGVIWASVKRSKKIIAVSEATKADIVRHFSVRSDKVAVIYEGVDKRFAPSQESSLLVNEKYDIKKPYVLFVGVWRQYKNLPRLAVAFDILKERYGADMELVLAGKIDPYYPEIREAVFSGKHSDRIRALGFVPEEDLPALYRGAAVFALPSLIEGFGLIGVEAQASRVPVAASDISVLREVLGGGAVYFDPLKPEDMAEKMNQILRNNQDIIAAGVENAKRFEWRRAAEETLRVYMEASKS